jgi:hypothetical protein
MSEEEDYARYRYLQLKAKAARGKAPAPKQEEYGRDEAFLKGAEQGLTLGFADELGAGLQSGLMKVADAIPEGVVRALPGMDGFKSGQASGDTYRLARDQNRAEYDKAKEEHGGYYLGGEIVGGSLLPTPGAGAVAKGATAANNLKLGARLLKAAKTGVKTGATMGAGYGLGASTEEDVGGMLEDTIKGGVLGGVTGGVLSTGAEAATSAGNALLKGVITPNASAKMLRKKGVDLTLGQMDPKSGFAKAEEASMKNSVFGGEIRGRRQQAAEQFEGVVLNEARAPGAKRLKRGGELEDRLGALKQGYDEAYGVLKGERIDPFMYEGQGKWRGFLTDESIKGAAKTKGLFELATANPNIRATDETRRTTFEFLKGQLTSLPKGADKNGMPAEAAQKLRSAIRSEIRRTLKGNPTVEDRAAAQMLKDAEEGVTAVMEAQLPAEVSEKLRATDAQYGKLRTVLDAAQRHADQDGPITAAQLSAAAKQGVGDKYAYALGAGGELRKLAKAGRRTIEAKEPQTGAMLLSMPGANWIQAMGTWAANKPGVMPYALGEAGAQKAMRAAVDPAIGLASKIPGSPTQSWIRTALDQRAPMSPAYASDEEEERQRAIAEALMRRPGAR